jgi:hypothetical protein
VIRSVKPAFQSAWLHSVLVPLVKVETNVFLCKGTVSQKKFARELAAC